MKNRIVYKKSTFPADIDTVYNLLTDLKTLQYIASPYASFEPIDSDENIVWTEGKKFIFSFKLFCIIPYGKHEINVMSFKKNEIYTNESNTFVPIWNHRIVLKGNNDGTTQYSDEVEFGAGWKTSIVWCWANLFYAHRQRKWLKLLKEKVSH